MKRVRILGKIIPKLSFSKELFFRFSVTFVLILLTCIASLLDNHGIYDLRKVIFFLIIATTLSAGVTLFLEDKEYSFVQKTALFGGGIVLAFVGIFLYENIFLILFLGAVLPLSFSQFLFKESTSESYFLASANLLIVTTFALFSVSILWLGLFAIFQSLSYLFEVRFYYFSSDIYIIIFTLIFPTLLLQDIKKVEDFKQKTIPHIEPLSFLIRGILVPLVLVYVIILYAYFGKIIIFQELPRGGLAWMILVFMVICLGTKILLLTLKEKQKVTLLFDQYCFHLLIVPIIFLYIAIFTRVSQYGFTEERFLVLFASLWISTVALLYIFYKNINLKHIFYLLSVGILIVSITPLNPTQVSANSQIKRFKKLLKKHNILQNDKIVPLKKQPTKPQRAQFSSLSYYIFSNKVAKKKVQELLHVELQEPNSLFKLLNIKPLKSYRENHSELSFSYDKNVAFYTGGYDYAFDITYMINGSRQEYLYSSGKGVSISLKEGVLSAVFEQVHQISFDLNRLLESLKSENIDEIDENNYEKVILVKEAKRFTPKVKLHIKELLISEDKDSPPKVEAISAYLLFSYK